MGTWSVKPFDNDSALDWLSELENSASYFLSYPMQKVLESETPFSSDSEEAIASAAIVIAAANESIKSIPKEAKKWILEYGFVPERYHLINAADALNKISTNSELLDLWCEAGDGERFRAVINGMLLQLESIDLANLPKREPKPRPIPRSLAKLVEHPDLLTNPVIRKRINSKLKNISDFSNGSEDTEWETPLCLMIRSGLTDEAHYLLDNGVDPTLIGASGSALAWASREGNLCLFTKIFDKISASSPNKIQ